MVTGVWSKRIKEANESNGLQPGAAMACAMGILCGVIGLGLKYKLRMLSMFATMVPLLRVFVTVFDNLDIPSSSLEIASNLHR